ncbi:MAG: SGNH/GDSL hydrolase family protein [Acidobacteria bacterium]|nr:SGNH/GDSL hydrolase family protein [Acidobacteriota bacterium]
MQQALAILFLGNSLTYTNDLPKIFTASSPVKVYAESVTAPGATLQILYEQTDALRKLHSRKWDYVVLQEQGSLGIAAVNGQRAVNHPNAFFGWSRIWDHEIRAAGAKTVFFHNWVRKPNPEDRPYVDYAFFEIAKQLKATNVPVGIAWARMPQDPLYVPDNLHPTIAGSYLTACVFTEALFRKPCINPPQGMTEEAARQIRTVAAAAVKDAATMQPAKPEFTAVTELPAVANLNVKDIIGAWTGETTFYTEPARLTLHITPDGPGCKVNYNVEGPRLRLSKVIATCTPAPNGVLITVNQLSGTVEMHTFQLRDGKLIGLSRLAPYTAYFRREATWTLERTTN